MERIIYKYPLEVRQGVIDLPSDDFDIVAVHEQNGMPTIWIELRLNGIPWELPFAVVGTGQNVPKGEVHAGTCFIGPNVWHVYVKND